MTEASIGRDPIDVWVLEDDENTRRTVQAWVNAAEDLSCRESFSCGEDLLEYVNREFAPEVLLVDIRLPGMSGIEVIRRFHYLSPRTNSIVLTAHQDDDLIFEAICAGAAGYLLKEAKRQLPADGGPALTLGDELRRAVREVHAGGAAITPEIGAKILNLFKQREAPKWDYSLTVKESEVLELMATEGLSKAQIARRLSKSYHTVDTQCRSIFTKLHVNTQTAAIAKAWREGLVRP